MRIVDITYVPISQDALSKDDLGRVVQFRDMNPNQTQFGILVGYDSKNIFINFNGSKNYLIIKSKRVFFVLRKTKLI